MEFSCPPLSRVPKTTRLFADYLEDFAAASAFYSHSPDEAGLLKSARAAASGRTTETAQTVTEVLREQNLAFGNDESAFRNLEMLARGAVAVVTGQQAGLFGGPAYTFYKALTAIHWANWLSRQGISAVPIFWVATEDHDFAEVSHVDWLSAGGVRRLELPPTQSSEARPVGSIVLGESIAKIIDDATSALAGAGAAGVNAALEASYQSAVTMGSAFGRLVAHLFRGRGMILLDPRDERLHRLAMPILRGAIEHAEEIGEDLAARNKLLDRSRYHAQVRFTQQSTLLFRVLDGKREAVRRKHSTFATGASLASKRDLLVEVSRAPESFSANVLLRPVMQDYLLPTAAYIGGPAEIAYFAQASAVYARLSQRMPVILPRASLTLVDPWAARRLRKYRLNLDDFFRGREFVRRKMETQFIPKNLERRFRRGEKALHRLLKGLRPSLRRLDVTLIGGLDTASRKMAYQYDQLRARAGRVENMRTGILDNDERLLTVSFYTSHGLQERSLSFLPFLAMQGEQLMDEILAHVEREGTLRHHILFLH